MKLREHLFEGIQTIELTEDELVDLYEKHNNVWKVAEELGIAGQTVHKWLTEIGAIHKMNYFNDDEILKQEYKNYRDKGELKELAKQLGRTVPFITRQAKRLGLTDSENHISMKFMARKLSEKAKEWHKNNPHPKGMFGKTHSEEFKATQSLRSKAAWANPNSKLNSEEFRQMRSDNMAKWQASKTDRSNNYNRTKYGWFEKDGEFLFMRSSWELNYAHYLNFLKSKNLIKDWTYEKDVFWFEKIRRGVRSYRPDFKIFETNGGITYHEVKGWMDKKSATKIKRMRLYYPQIKLRIIDQKSYKAIAKQSSLYPGWGTWLTEKPKGNSLMPELEIA